MIEPILGAILEVIHNPTPNQVKAYVHERTLDKGWSNHQWKCLSKIIHTESRFQWDAKNGHAYGYAQLMGLKPGATMRQQTSRLMSYLAHRYDNACDAWEHHQRRGWY